MQFCGVFVLISLAQIFVAVVVTALEEESCSNAANLLAALSADDVHHQDNIIIYSTPNAGYSNNTCGLSETCCSPEAEEHFLRILSKLHQSRLHHNLNVTVYPCLTQFDSSHVLSTTIDFVQTSKSSLIELVTAQLRQWFQGSDDIFNHFFDYVENGITALDLCEIQSKYEDMIFKVYFATFKGYVEDNSYIIPTELPFEQCLRSYVLSIYEDSLTRDHRRLRERYNLFFRWITALKTAEQAVSKALNYALTTDCINAIFKLDACAQCSGKDESIAPCSSFCRNTFRGCLVDIYEFVAVLKELIDVLNSVQDTVSIYSPFDALNLIQNQVNNIIGDFFATNANTLTTAVGDFCGIIFQQSSRRRRNLSRVIHHLSVKQATTAPIGAIAEVVTCYNNAINTLDQLPNTLCNASVSDFDCWNGEIVGNYSFPVVEADRVSQLQNPTLCIRSSTGLSFFNAIAEIKQIKSNLSSCGAHVPQCDVQLCEVTFPSSYNLSMESRYSSFSEHHSSNGRCAANVSYAVDSSSALQRTVTTGMLTSHIAPTTTLTSIALTRTTTSTPIVPNRTEASKISSLTSDRVPLATNIDNPNIPDADKEKINSSSLILGPSLITIITTVISVTILSGSSLIVH